MFNPTIERLKTNPLDSRIDPPTGNLHGREVKNIPESYVIACKVLELISVWMPPISLVAGGIFLCTYGHDMYQFIAGISLILSAISIIHFLSLKNKEQEPEFPK